MKVRYCDVIVERNMYEKFPVQVYEHEVPILQLIHGKDFVKKYQKPLMRFNVKTKMQEQKGFVRYPIEDISAEEEYNRLNTKYKRNADQPRFNVEIVYGEVEEGRFENKYAEYYRDLIAKGYPQKAPKMYTEADYEPLPGEEFAYDEFDGVAPEGEPVADIVQLGGSEAYTKIGIMQLLDQIGGEYDKNSTKDEMWEQYLKLKGLGPEEQTFDEVELTEEDIESATHIGDIEDV